MGIKQYKFTRHAKERLFEMGLDEKDGHKLVALAKWYTVPVGHLVHKLYTLKNQFGIVYYLYTKRDKTYPSVLFTMREYKDHFLVITATKK